MLRRAYELGVNFIDTADAYGPDVSEKLIAEALHPYPDDLVIATKGGLTRSGPEQVGGRRPAGALREGLRGEPEPAEDGPDHPLPVPPARSRRCPWRSRSARWWHEGRGEDPAHRGVQRDRDRVAPGPAADPGGVRPEPLQRGRPDVGVDGRPVRAGDGWPSCPGPPSSTSRRTGRWPRSPRTTRRTPRQVVLAWLLARSPAILPIPGTGTVGHLEENVAAAGIKLEGHEIEALTAGKRYRSG